MAVQRYRSFGSCETISPDNFSYRISSARCANKLSTPSSKLRFTQNCTILTSFEIFLVKSPIHSHRLARIRNRQYSRRSIILLYFWQSHWISSMAILFGSYGTILDDRWFLIILIGLITFITLLLFIRFDNNCRSFQCWLRSSHVFQFRLLQGHCYRSWWKIFQMKIWNGPEKGMFWCY